MPFLRPNLLFNISRQFSTNFVYRAYWNKNWKPGPYPKTEEERLEAAKKYGLLPIEYEPIPDDGEGAGDYPDIEIISAEARDPFYPWDYPEYQRNYNEVMHQDFNIYSEDRYNFNTKPKYSQTAMLSGFLGTMIVCYILYKLSDNTCFPPVAQKHMPAQGVKHYSYT